jgi:hypothetical protein
MRKTNARVAWTAKAGKLTAVTLGAAALGWSMVPPPPAEACGGFFCNQPDSPFAPPPVAQTAENVLFAMDRNPAGQYNLEAHVQIFYTGPADRFSWVVPVDSEPKLDVGTNRLFQVVEQTTRPSHGINYREEGTCKQVTSPPAGNPGSGGSGGAAGVADAGASPRDGGAGVDVTFRGDVGPYDAAVVRSTNTNDPKPLKDWLTENKYFISEEASKLIDDYVREDKWFVAIRLISGKGTQEILPLVMRFVGPSPCVPLRLTAIASIRDLKVNLWVLSDRRVVPTNYYEIKLNDARINWFDGGRNYDELVKRAADEAGGNAFTTEYAGPANVVRGLIDMGTYDAARFMQVRTPPDAMSEVIRQNIPRDAALLAILRAHIPLPEVLRARGVTEQQFYNQLFSYWQSNMRDFAPFDPAKFAAEINDKIIRPVKAAQMLFDRFTKLTRLSTFISPEEMSVDPLFANNATLPDVPARRVANGFIMCGDRQFTRCEAPLRLELPDGQKLYFRPRPTQGPCYSFSTAQYDRGNLDMMPASELAWQRDPIGEGTLRVNNRPAIEAAVFAHNNAMRAPMPVNPGGGPMVNPVPPGPGNSPTMPPLGPMTGTPPDPGMMGGTGSQRSGGCALAGGDPANDVGGPAAAALATLAATLAAARRRRRK